MTRAKLATAAFGIATAAIVAVGSQALEFASWQAS